MLATEFLQKYPVTMEWTYIGDDHSTRFEFRVHLTVGKAVFTFPYHMGFAHVLKNKVSMANTAGLHPPVESENAAKFWLAWQPPYFGKDAKYWLAVKTVGDMRDFCRYAQITLRIKYPLIEDVLLCLVADCQTVEYSEDFDGFLSEYGYTYNKESRGIWDACKKTRKEIKKLIGSAGYADLLQLEEGE